jgi:DNA-binding LacI/PurR family transcriptional regulator
MRQLLRLHKPPTAVVTSNDVTAIGALGAIYTAGLRVPDDIAVVGFDDIAFASLTQPPLTTVSLSRVQLAVTALAALEQLIRRESTRKIEYRITTHLVVRQSTRAI